MRRFALFLVSTVLASGCSATVSNSDAGGLRHDAANVSGPATFALGEGVIEGHVVDDEYVPVPNATVRIFELALSTLTDASGDYSLPRVPAGTWTVLAENEGYETMAGAAVVREGEVTTVRFGLHALPKTGVPYVSTPPVWHGAIRCVVAGVLFIVCHNPAVHGIFGTDFWIHNFPAVRGLTALQDELTWVPSSGQGPRTLALDRDGLSWVDSAKRGSSPVVLRAVGPANDTNEWWTWPPDYSNIRDSVEPYFDVTRDGPERTVDQTFLEQRFDVHHTQFYWGAEIPDDYKARPDE